MSLHVELARAHAARAMDALARAERGEPINSNPQSIGPHHELGALRAHVRILAQDIETLTQESVQCQL